MKTTHAAYQIDDSELSLNHRVVDSSVPGNNPLYDSLGQDLNILSDQDLLALYQETTNKRVKDDIFERIYTRHYRNIFGKALQMLGNETDANDATQEIFLKIHKKIHTFNNDSKFSTWYFSITKNYCIDFIRLKKKTIDRHQAFLTTVSITQDPDFGDQERENLMDPTLLWATIEESSMVNNSKEALLLKFRDGLSIRDIAERLDISESAIKMRILRGKKYLKKSFNNNIDY